MQKKMLYDLNPEQKPTGYAYRQNKTEILVDFEGVRERGKVMSRIDQPRLPGGFLYVVLFENFGRMLGGTVLGAEFDCEKREAHYFNPCGADNIEDCGLDTSIFNTHYEGGLFEVVSDLAIGGQPAIGGPTLEQ